MVWYVPPLSPIVSALETDGYEADPDAGLPGDRADADPGRLPRQPARRRRRRGDPRRAAPPGGDARPHAQARGPRRARRGDAATAVGMSVDDVEDMYRLLAIANYDDRYVIPQAHAELADRLMEQQGTCGLDFEGGPGNCGAVGGPSPTPTPRASCSPRTSRPASSTSCRSPAAGAARTGGLMAPRPAPRRRAATVYKLCSLLLQYPDEELLRGARGARRGASPSCRARRRGDGARALPRLVGREPTRCDRRSTTSRRFDLSKRSGLYLTFYGDGDKRERGSGAAAPEAALPGRRAAAGGHRAARLPAGDARVRRLGAARARRDRPARAPRRARAGPAQPARARQPVRGPARRRLPTRSARHRRAERATGRPARRRAVRRRSWSGSSPSRRPR